MSSSRFWVGLYTTSSTRPPVVCAVADTKSNLKSEMNARLQQLVDADGGPKRPIHWNTNGLIEYTDPIASGWFHGPRAFIRPYDSSTSANGWLNDFANDPHGLLQYALTVQSRGRSLSVIHLCPTSSYRKHMIEDSSISLGSRAVDRFSRIISQTTRGEVMITVTTFLIWSDIFLRALGDTVTLGPVSSLRESKQAFVATATTLSFSLTGFVLTGLAVVAVAAIVYGQGDTQENDENQPSEPNGEDFESESGPEDSDIQGEQIQRLALSFKEGTVLAISASLLGIVFQTVETAIPSLVTGAAGTVQVFNYYIVFYVFVLVFVGMVLTAVDLAELILSVVNEHTNQD